MEKETLTNKQLFIYNCIKKFIEKYGYSPTVREICKMASLSSSATVYVHLQKLSEKGYITYIPKSSRTIKLTKDIGALEENILNEVTGFCELCYSRECCKEENCVLYRIEQLVVNSDSYKDSTQEVD